MHKPLVLSGDSREGEPRSSSSLLKTMAGGDTSPPVMDGTCCLADRNETGMKESGDGLFYFIFHPRRMFDEAHLESLPENCARRLFQ